MTDPAPSVIAAGGRKAATVFIFFTVLLDILALGVIIPVLPHLIEDFLGGDTVKAVEIFGVFGTLWAAMQFVFSPILGCLSDRVGRRPVILLSNLGLGLDYVLTALAPTLSWLFVARIISGITAASFSTAGAYIADVNPPEKRGEAFGMLGAAFGIGFVLGPATGGVLGGIDVRLPFWVAAGLSLANAAYGFFVLPESLPEDRRSPFRWRKANPVGSLILLKRTRTLSGIAAATFFAQLAHVVLPSVFVLYAAFRYHWAERQVGWCLAFVGVCAMIVQAGLVGPAIKLFGEKRTLYIGWLFGAAGFVIYGLATEWWMFIIGVPVMSLWGMSGAAAQGLMTREVRDDEQGALQGANTSLQGIAELIGPSIFTGAFALFISDKAPFVLPGAPFLLSAVFLLMGVLISAVILRTREPA